MRPNRILITIALLAAPSLSSAFCFEEAGHRYGLDPVLIKAIAKVENVTQDPYAVGRNTDGTYDYGLMQINSSWAPALEKIGIPWESLSDPCTNVMVGAWILRQKIEKHGYSWKGVAAYHSATPSKNAIYARKLARELKGGTY